MDTALPVHYQIHLIPDMEHFRFEGQLRLDLTAKVATSSIILDSLDLTYQQIRLDGEQQDLDFSIDLASQQLRITLPEPMKGKLSLSIHYQGEINDKLAGLYRSRYEVDGDERFAAVTQFQESDARRAFPCFDQPQYKATFAISFTVPEEFETISNTSIEDIEKLGDKKRVTFEQTPKMSTYLVFFAFGEFDWIEERFDNIPLRVVTSPGKAQAYGSLAMDYGRKSLQYCQQYFDIPYPLSKMDLIATPDFAAGAMENWGAILFRENLLLDYPESSTIMDRRTIKEVIAHEVAHQWFGNLVSPDKWKYVWLNESFATYFAYKTIDHYEPEFGIFDYFIGETVDNALRADGYHETAAIEQQGDEPAPYTAKTIPILYSKGASVLRQLEGFLGKKGFQAGLQYYLNEHRYDVAGSEDLWQAFEEVSQQPISQMMRQWVMLQGYPQIEAKRQENRLQLEQHRFTFLNRSYDTTWTVPLTVRQYLHTGEVKDSAYLMETSSLTLELDDDCRWFKLNQGHTGFYRVLYELETYDQMAAHIRDKQLQPIDRYNIENDLYAFVYSGRIALGYYLSYLDHYSSESNHLPLGSISNHLNELFDTLDGQIQEEVASVGKRFHEQLLERYGYEQQQDEHHSITIMRGRLINRAAKFGSETAKSFARQQFELLQQGTAIDPNTLVAILVIMAKETNDWDWYSSQLGTVESEAEKQSYIVAMANFSSEENIEQFQSFVFEKIPPRNQGTAIQVFSTNPHARTGIWEWFLANLDNFGKLHPLIQQSAFPSVIVASSDHRQEVGDFFADYVKQHPATKDAVDKAIEALDIRKRLKERYEIDLQ